MTPPPLAPGGTIGILGGGQLGRMLALAAAELGLRSHVYCPDPDSPAFDVTRHHTCAAYDDEAALSRFVDSVDRVTFEFENVPHFTVAFLASKVPVLPGERALRLTQDRLDEKHFVSSLGLSVAPFAAVDSAADLGAALRDIGRPAILKTRRFGYDGKGQIAIRGETDPESVWSEIGNAPCVLEGFVPFALECSVIVARSAAGQIAPYEIVENHHENHILKTSTVPARVSAETANEAERIGRVIAEALDFVGVLAVELFVTRQNGREALIVNEIAPRVHNSGHWTQDGCLVSQFEQHMRAVAGWPLGSPHRHSDVVMTNLLGVDADLWEHYASEAGTALHLYGKSSARAGRKMGHINRLGLPRR
ncbi:5-(carboxyamino)imidazole ribonucleotide synthase [Rhodoligotrophos appendicifer]|uniref:5-(carboxyamino)imidazole ribonucleotide synthase n=1 Tax=Rhodoligotrophos appendicifer TaxID=987056 RepID=UPI0011863E73|nr:5-(carboxyamino)imidazole ribonucleotide synthase [Rhodoligotrophos appendicifer]